MGLNAALLLLQVARSVTASGITGVVQAAESGQRLAKVLIVVADSPHWAVSDSLGQYSLPGLPPGFHRIRFARMGRRPVVLSVLVALGSVVRVDVELSPAVAQLAPIVVTVPRRPPESVTDEVTALRLGTGWSRAGIPGPMDVQNALSRLEGAATRGDGSGGLTLQGGESDQVGVHVDGFPVLGATHFGSALSAVNPDLIRGIEVRLGAPPAQFGGWLSGTILLQSSLFAADSAKAVGALTPTDLRQLLRLDLPASVGRLLLSGRRSYRNLWGDGRLPESGNGYEDWLGSLGAPLGGGRFQALVVESRNQLGFPSRIEPGDSESVASPVPRASSSNDLEWRSGTIGAAWQRGWSEKERTLGVRLWRASTASSVTWDSPVSPVALNNNFTQVALQLDGSMPALGGTLTFGGGVTANRSQYSAGRPAFPTALRVITHSTVLLGYLEHQRRLGSFLAIRTGIRANHFLSGWTGFEPRLGLEVRPTQWLQISAAAGRLYQFTQSLRNQESFLSSVLALDLPAGVGTAGVTRASSDNLAFAVQASPAERTTVGFRAYLRRFQGLVLGAPGASQPFFASAAAVGTGSAAGTDIRLSHEHGAVRFDAALATARALRRLDSRTRYQPGFLRSMGFLVQVVVTPNQGTVLGLAVQGGSGQLTTLVRDLSWRSWDAAGAGELLGTPDNVEVAINQRRLPAVLRIDLGASRRWTLPPWLSRGEVHAALAVENLFNRRNVMALAASAATGLPRPLLARPRTIRLELGWRF